MESSNKTRLLLPTNVQPSHYDIHFTPNLTECTFHGREEVSVVVKQETKNIVINSQGLKIPYVVFQTCFGHLINSTGITFQETQQTVTFEFAEALPVGKGTLTVEFDGILDDSMMGFYRSKYTVNGEQRYVATTQMEPTGARKAFPCWDEPALKATFGITLTVPENRTALSNTEEISSSTANGLKTVKYAHTPIMSTYLLAFVIGEFDYVEGKTKEGTEVRVFTPLGKKNTGTFSLDVAIKVLSYFNEYYGIPYPLKKLDMIAIADFSAGAMENWGLITYRETALLIDETSGVASKQRVAYVVAHELAHQWFGNLVTMQWWKELWLNEGFATFVGNQAIAHLYPQWDIWTQFVSQYFNRALDLDGLESSHPVEVEVYSSSEIEEIFDIISYSKGASVVRMVAYLVGEENFRKGLNIYLNRHKYSNAVTEDLWKALEEASGFKVGEFMNTYTKVTGYPLLTFETVDAKEGKYKMQQRRFLQSGVEDTSNAQWWISSSIALPNSTSKLNFDLKFKKEGEVVLKEAIGKSWIKVNPGQSTFMRVKYSDDILTQLSKAITNLELSALDRIGLQNDAFSLAKAGLLPTSKALLITKGYINENDYTVWSDLSINLGGMATVWSNESNYPELQEFIRNLFAKIHKKLGWDKNDGESDLDTLLRSTVLNQLGSFEDKSVIEEARKRFALHLEGKSKIPADLRFLVYSLVVGNGGKDEYEKVFNIFKTADMHDEKLQALRALGYSKDLDLIKRTLELSLTEEVRGQDIMYATMSCSHNRVGREMAWNYFKTNFAQYKSRVGETAMVFDRVIGFMIKFFTSEEKVVEIEQFFKEHPVPSAERTIKQAVESIRSNIKWLKNNREETALWLTSNKSF